MTPTLKNRWDETVSPLTDASPIQDFYSGAKLLITGATGYVGRTLTEKLLRSCHKIDTIYYIVRPKKGNTANSRHEKFLNTVVFEFLRKEKPEVLKKLVPISGDVGESNLGLSTQDQLTLQQHVNVVFHSAATVRFDEKLSDAYNLNTLGTTRVLELCKGIESLKALVYVSTAYSNSDKREIREEVYPGPDIKRVLEVCKIENEREQEIATKKLLGGHPNTYTITKALAETFVNKHAKEIPVCIVRPSIVTGALTEPKPGWIDNLASSAGFAAEMARGTLKSILCEETSKVDVIPVDIVVNTLIAAAWRTHDQKRSDGYNQEKVTVYNCTTGGLNPLLWHDLGRLIEKHALVYPSKYVTFYPGFTFRTNLLTHWLITIFYQLLPALLFDTYLFCTGQRTYMFSLTKKFITACHVGCFFALHGWNFHCDNIVALQEAVNREPNDTADFPLDVRAINWDDYFKNFIIGLRVFALRDPLTSLPAARRKLNRIYWISTATLYSFYAFVGYTIYSVMTWCLQ